MASDFRSKVETQILKKKAPKLRPLDRAMSLAIENYATGNISTQSGIGYDPTHLDSAIVLTPTSSHSASSATQDFTKKSNIFYIDSSSNSLNNYPDYKHLSRTHHLPRKQSAVRRSGPLDVYGTGAFDIRKTHSFNSHPPPNSSAEDLLLMSRRTNSMRHTSGGAAAAYSHEFSVPSDALIIPPIPIGGDVVVGGAAATSSANRRNCRMHKSFHERRHDTKRETAIEAVKCHSLGDDGSDDDPLSGVKRKLSPKFNSANSSLENEVFHTRSNSRNKIETEAIDVHDPSAVATTVITPSMAAAAKKVMTAASGVSAASHKHSSHSLDKPHHSFRRIARATQSFYVNPNQYEELRLQRAMQNAAAAAATTSTSSGLTFAGAAKRVHSASMRTKPFRETLAETKKSKSFVADPFVEYDMSGHRRDSKLFDSGVSVISDVKKSPRLSSNLMLTDASNFEGGDLAEYDGIMRAYRQNRNSSIVSGGVVGSGKKKSSSKKKKSIDGVAGSETGLDDDGDGEPTRKRKRLVCIIVSVFLSLVFASVFVVVFTLTHSTAPQVPDQTRRVYTFAPGPVGNRDSPIHHYNSNTNGNYASIFHNVFNLNRQLHSAQINEGNT